MKLTKQRLREIIKEELSRALDDTKIRRAAKEAAEKKKERGEPITTAGTQNLRRFDPSEKESPDPEEIGLDTLEMTGEDYEEWRDRGLFRESLKAPARNKNMKITKQRLKEIIREELEAATNPLDPHAGGRKPTHGGLQGIFDEAGLTPEEVIEVQSVLSGDETDWMNTQSYEKLYQYYAFGGGGMPYGVAKARDGDPVDWILDQLEELEETL